MKKYLLIPIIGTFLASCGLTGGTKTDFTSLYNANIKAEIAKIDSSFQDFYKTKEGSGTFSGALHFVGELPKYISMNTGIEALANGHQSHATLLNPHIKMVFNAHEGSGTLTADVSAKSFEGVSDTFANYLKYEGVSANLDLNTTPALPEKQKELEMKKTQVLEKLSQFSGKWISFQGQEALTPEQMKILEALIKTRPADIENYLTKYPLLVPTSSGAVNGDEYTFNVKFSPENAVNLIAEVNKNITGSGTSAENMLQAKEAISQLSVSGTVTYNAKNSLFSKQHLMIVHTQSPDYAIIVDYARDNGLFDVKYSAFDKTANRNIGTLAINSVSKGKTTNFSVNVLVNQGEKPEDVAKIAEIQGIIEDETLKTLKGKGGIPLIGTFTLDYMHKGKSSFVVVAQGKPLFSLNNEYSDDNFHGNLLIQGKEAGTWQVEMHKDMLKKLVFNLKDVIFSQQENPKDIIQMNLVSQPNSDMIKGKVLVNTLETGLHNIEGSADVSLQFVKNSKIGLIIENILSGGKPLETGVSKAEVFMTLRPETVSAKKIVIPASAVPQEEFLQHMSEIDNMLETSTINNTLPQKEGEEEVSHKKLEPVVVPPAKK